MEQFHLRQDFLLCPSSLLRRRRHTPEPGYIGHSQRVLRGSPTPFAPYLQPLTACRLGAFVALVYYWCIKASTQCRGFSSFRVSGLSKPIRESRRADSNRLPLLITSDNRSGARSCRVVQSTCKPALIYLELPSATSGPTLPVVSEWHQKVTGD
jgi:hypothetical protein